MKLFRLLIWVQGAYTLVTALWALMDIESFMQVTGYKTDVWLVKTVGALLVPIALSLGVHLFIRTDHRPAWILGGLTAAAFIVIDFYYALKNVIANIYMADGVVQILFFAAWLYIGTKHYKHLKQNDG